MCVQGGLTRSKGEVVAYGNVLDFMGCLDEFNKKTHFSFMGKICHGDRFPLSTGFLHVSTMVNSQLIQMSIHVFREKSDGSVLS